MIMSRVESDLEKTFRTSIQKDINSILTEYISSSSSTTFSEFNRIWEKTNFGLILCMRPDELPYDWFMDCLFDETIEAIMATESDDVLLGAIFLLYHLHQAQLENHPISASRRVWMKLVELDGLSKKQIKLTEIHCILGTLVHTKAFSFVAMTKKETALAHEAFINQQETCSTTDDYTVVIQNELDKLEKKIKDEQNHTFIESPTILEQAERMYVKEKARVVPLVQDPTSCSLIKADLSKDLLQTQRDLISTAQIAQSKWLSETRASKAKARRPTVPNRPATASPSTTATPDYIISADHMPSLF